MAYQPFALQLFDAILNALRTGMSAELEAVDAAPLADSAFVVADPALHMGDCVALLPAGTERERQAQHWRETTHHFEVHVFGVGVDIAGLSHRLIALEYAVAQVIDKHETMNGMLRTITIGRSEPVALDLNSGSMFGGIGIPISCEPAVRLSRPEHTS